jgi:hypothetical protein
MKKYLKIYLLVLFCIFALASIFYILESFIQWKFVELDPKAENIRLFIVAYTIIFTVCYSLDYNED